MSEVTKEDIHQMHLDLKKEILELNLKILRLDGKVEILGYKK